MLVNFLWFSGCTEARGNRYGHCGSLSRFTAGIQTMFSILYIILFNTNITSTSTFAPTPRPPHLYRSTNTMRIIIPTPPSDFPCAPISYSRENVPRDHPSSLSTISRFQYSLQLRLLHPKWYEIQHFLSHILSYTFITRFDFLIRHLMTVTR